jgi:hypothetical protein
LNEVARIAADYPDYQLDFTEIKKLQVLIGCDLSDTKQKIASLKAKLDDLIKGKDRHPGPYKEDIRRNDRSSLPSSAPPNTISTQ